MQGCRSFYVDQKNMLKSKVRRGLIYKKYLKRLFDIILSVFAIIILSPFILILSLVIRIKLGSPIIFRQNRVGKDEKQFYIYKFRTMTDERDGKGNLLPDEHRLTKFGKMLRSTSLDELPELVNIIKGDLSIIGPRSLLVEYLPYYTDYEKQRHTVRGGLIPPEVLYNNIMPTWEDQFIYEVEYANNLSILLDLKILFATFKGLFTRNKQNYGSYVRRSLIDERK